MTMTSHKLTDFKALSFDIYGTLINWEPSINTSLTALHKRLDDNSPYKANTAGFVAEFRRLEHLVEVEEPSQRYSAILTQAYSRLAAQENVIISKEEAEGFGGSVGNWPAFPDTVQAMQRLGKHYKLIVLSNVDRESFQRTLTGPLSGVHFEAIYTAEDIGSYKPALRNFEYLISHVKSDLGVDKNQLLHTAQSLFHDHVPAKEIGLVSTWIARGKDDGKSTTVDDLTELKGKTDITWQFGSLGEMAEAVEAAFQE